MSPTRRTNEATAGPNEVAAAKTPAKTKSSERTGRVKRSSAKKAAAPSAKAAKASPGRRTPDSKQDQIVALLRQPGGTTLDVLVKSTGWQKHSVRGFLAGTVRKKLKLPLLSRKDRRLRTYRIGASRAVKAAKKTTAGVIRCPGGNVMRQLWRPRSRVCPISAMNELRKRWKLLFGVPPPIAEAQVHGAGRGYQMQVVASRPVRGQRNAGSRNCYAISNGDRTGVFSRIQISRHATHPAVAEHDPHRDGSRRRVRPGWPDL